jgi:hypothetical protein
MDAPAARPPVFESHPKTERYKSGAPLHNLRSAAPPDAVRIIRRRVRWCELGVVAAPRTSISRAIKLKQLAQLLRKEATGRTGARGISVWRVCVRVRVID